jgi:antitoxin HigA-1
MSEMQLSEIKESDEMLPLLTPGEFLRLEFMEPLDITPYRLAKDVGVDQGRIEGILDGRRTITPDTAMRLSRYFGTSAEMWLNLQSLYDLRRVEREAETGGLYDRITMHPAVAKALATV